jgi:SAM-dependent methyltransferase
MFRLIPRLVCPACLHDAGQQTLCAIPYSRLGAFLERSYVRSSIEEHLPNILRHDYAIVECSRCLLLYQRNVPDTASMEILYSEMISPDATFDRHRLHMDDLAYYERHVRDVFAVFSHLNRHPSRIRVLDFGSGWAQWARVAKAVGAETFIAEISEKQIENARTLGIGNIDIFGYSGPAFDYIHTQDVFEHLPEPRRMLGQLTRLLKKGGIIRLAVPPGFKMKSRIARFAETNIDNLPELAPLQHINNFSQPTLSRFAGQFGLAPVYVRPKYSNAAEHAKSLTLRNEAVLNTLLYALTKKRISPYPYFTMP